MPHPTFKDFENICLEEAPLSEREKVNYQEIWDILYENGWHPEDLIDSLSNIRSASLAVSPLRPVEPYKC